MSGEQLANHNKTKKVNINILLNKVRADKKREQLESNIFFGIVVLENVSIKYVFVPVTWIL